MKIDVDHWRWGPTGAPPQLPWLPAGTGFRISKRRASDGSATQAPSGGSSSTQSAHVLACTSTVAVLPQGSTRDPVLSDWEEQGLIKRARERLNRWPWLQVTDMHPAEMRPGMQRFCKAADARELGDPGPNVFILSHPRWPSRLGKALESLHIAGLNSTIVDAFDEQALLCQKDLDELGVRQVPGSDWHSKQGAGLTTADVARFMTHYTVWQRMVEDGTEAALILEDGFVMAADFRDRLGDCLEAARTEPWNIFLLSGGSANTRHPEAPELLMHPGRCLDCRGYILRLGGALGLLEARAYLSMAPLDEYFSAAFLSGDELAPARCQDKAPWKVQVRQVLLALAASQPLVDFQSGHAWHTACSVTLLESLPSSLQ